MLLLCLGVYVFLPAVLPSFFFTRLTAQLCYPRSSRLCPMPVLLERVISLGCCATPALRSCKHVGQSSQGSSGASGAWKSARRCSLAQCAVCRSWSGAGESSALGQRARLRPSACWGGCLARRRRRLPAVRRCALLSRCVCARCGAGGRRRLRACTALAGLLCRLGCVGCSARAAAAAAPPQGWRCARGGRGCPERGGVAAGQGRRGRSSFV
jgi:hypothetical protein